MNYSKRFLRFLNNEEVERGSNFFIGIVREVITKDSTNLLSHLETEEYKDLIDNRNVILITPAHSKVNNIEPAFFLNNHSIDLPLLGEAVFCIKTSMGNFIIDRFSLNQFALNYDSYEWLMSNIVHGKDIEIEYPKEYEDVFNKETVHEVAPFDMKEGGKYFLGRNNQYFIFDHTQRKNSSPIEEENTKHGNYIKLGFRNRGNQSDTREDSVLMVMSKQASLNHLLTERYNSKLKNKNVEQVNSGLGLQADHFLCVGRYFTVIFSLKDLLIEAKDKLFLISNKLEIENNNTNIKSPEIKLGINPNQSFVRGEDLVNAMRQIISLIRNARYLVAGTSTTSADPTFNAQLRSFEARYLNNNSPILSKKIKGE